MQSGKLCRKGQAKKSARGIPWHWEPKKDVANGGGARGAGEGGGGGGVPKGATRTDNIRAVHAE